MTSATASAMKTRSGWSWWPSIFSSDAEILHERALKAEYKLFSRLSFFDHGGKLTEAAATAIKEDNGDISQKTLENSVHNSKAYARVETIQLNDGKHINTLVLDLDGNQDFSQPAKKTLVLTHGFGAAIGFWFKNLHGLSIMDEPGLRIYAIDWLGMGRSSRVPLPKKHHHATVEEDVETVENYFVDALEEWRVKCNIKDKFYLLGHSLGGYFSTVYALKYPDNIQKLILCSPAGIPEGDFTQVFQTNEMSLSRRSMFFVAKSLWEAGYTPQAIVRGTGSWGIGMIQKYAKNRFRNMTDEETDDIFEYLSAITAMEGAGEYAMGRLLKPGAFAKRPLASRLEDLKMETVFMYGEQDWMDPAIPLTKIEEKKLHPKSSLVIVPEASHQVFLDNPEYFNKVVADALKN